MVTFESGQHSVPAHLLGARVFVRTHGTGPDEEVIIVHHGTAGPVKVARHGRARPGSPAINDDHFPGTRAKVPGDYEVRARSADEAAFLAIGDAALHGRFAHPDLASILNANIRRITTHAVNEATSLAQGTSAWAAIGNPARTTTANTTPEEAR